MTSKLKVRKIGSSLGVILPKEELAHLKVAEGDALYAVKREDGLQLQPYDPDFERKLEAFELTRKRYRNALRELAK